jgi:hypothetical protein
MTQTYNSLKEYIALLEEPYFVTNTVVVNTELPVDFANGVEDAVFLNAISSSVSDASHYLVASAMIKLSIRAKRTKLAKKLIKKGIARFEYYDEDKTYIDGMLASIFTPAIRSANTKVLRFAANLLFNHPNIQISFDVGDFIDASKLGEDKGSKITSILLDYTSRQVDNDITTMTFAASQAIKSNIRWQADLLLDNGARISEFSKKEIRQVLGSHKNALLNLPEKRSQLLPVLLRRYLDQKNQPPNPIDYLSICPEWQKPHIMEAISHL